jgi:hypothetical protein
VVQACEVGLCVCQGADNDVLRCIVRGSGMGGRLRSSLGLLKSCGLGAFGGVPVAGWVFCGQRILGVACGKFWGQ